MPPYVQKTMFRYLLYLNGVCISLCDLVLNGNGMGVSISAVHDLFSMSCLEPPIVTPGMVKEECYVCSSNKQFEYESEEKLNAMLRLQYDNVSYSVRDNYTHTHTRS